MSFSGMLKATFPLNYNMGLLYRVQITQKYADENNGSDLPITSL